MRHYLRFAWVHQCINSRPSLDGLYSDSEWLNPTKSWWTLLKRPSETKRERGNTDNKYIVVLLWTVWTGSTSGAGTANPSGAPEFTTGFCGIHVTRSLALCVLVSSNSSQLMVSSKSVMFIYFYNSSFY